MEHDRNQVERVRQVKCRIRDWYGDWTSEARSEIGIPVGEANIGASPEPDLIRALGTRPSIVVLERNTGHASSIGLAWSYSQIPLSVPAFNRFGHGLIGQMGIDLGRLGRCMS